MLYVNQTVDRALACLVAKGIRTLEVALCERGRGQGGGLEVGAGQIGTRQVGVVEPGAGEVCASQVSLWQHSI